MTPRTIVSWVLVVLAAALLVVDTIVVAQTQSLWSEDALTKHGWPLVNIASSGAALIGALIVSREGRNPVGWLLIAIGTSTSVSLLAESYAYWAYETGDPAAHPFSTPAAHLATITGGVLALACLTVVFLIVPDGRFQSPRGRAVAVVAGIAYVMFIVGQVSYDPLRSFDEPADLSDVPVLVQVLGNLGFALIALCVLTSMVAMLLRFKRSTGETRQQLRWIATGAAAIGFAVLCIAVGQALNGGRAEWYTNVPLYVAYLYLLVTIAIAVLRYRLYDIDLVVTRALLLTAATVFVAGCYIVLVLVLGDRLSWDDGFWPSLVATMVVAFAFQPLRYHLLRLANRIAYGDRAAPYDALADFSRRLGQSPDTSVLLPTIAEAAGRATLATKAMVRLDVGAAGVTMASWPEPDEAWSADEDARVQVPVQDADGRLGVICVWPPPGLEVRPQDRRLLHDIARQAAVALRNTGLEVELAAHVALLDRQTDELAASRRRLIETDDAERRRLEAAISREVLPTLDAVHGSLTAVRAGGATISPDVLVDEATQALESLRELTRGIFPTLLTRSGLAPALTSYFARQGRPDDLTLSDEVRGRRFGERVEFAAYFCSTEAVVGTDHPARVSVRVDDGWLHVDVGLASTERLDLAALADRVEACGGEVRIAGGGGAGGLFVRLPVATDQDEVVASSHA